jgi:cold shock CspA family protein
MQGRITKFISEKGYGFIKDQNGDDRFFHISDVKSMEKIEINQLVKFQPNENSKGKNAKEITFNSKSKKFIKFDTHRIKVTNIKSFNISKEVRKKEKSFEEFDGAEKVFTSLDAIASLIGAPTSGANHKQYKKFEVKVLHIKTYQNDNYYFAEDEVKFNLEDKILELEQNTNI